MLEPPPQPAPQPAAAMRRVPPPLPTIAIWQDRILTALMISLGCGQLPLLAALATVAAIAAAGELSPALLTACIAIAIIGGVACLLVVACVLLLCALESRLPAPNRGDNRGGNRGNNDGDDPVVDLAQRMVRNIPEREARERLAALDAALTRLYRETTPNAAVGFGLAVEALAPGVVNEA